MPGFGSVSDCHANEEQLRVSALFKGGGSASDCVIQTTNHKVVKALAYNSSTGTFLLKLYDWPGNLVRAHVQSHPTSGADKFHVTVDYANISKTAYTIPVYIRNASGTLADPATTNYVDVELVFQRTN